MNVSTNKQWMCVLATTVLVEMYIHIGCSADGNDDQNYYTLVKN